MQALVLGDPTGDLPGAKNEAIIVASYLGVKPVLGKGASKAALIQSPLDPGVIHIASHGTFNEQDPFLSGVYLADGLFTVDDLMDQTIPAGLIVLSGCVTGRSERRPGIDHYPLITMFPNHMRIVQIASFVPKD